MSTEEEQPRRPRLTRFQFGKEDEDDPAAMARVIREIRRQRLRERERERERDDEES